MSRFVFLSGDRITSKRTPLINDESTKIESLNDILLYLFVFGVCFFFSESRSFTILTQGLTESIFSVFYESKDGVIIKP